MTRQCRLVGGWSSLLGLLIADVCVGAEDLQTSIHYLDFGTTSYESVRPENIEDHADCVIRVSDRSAFSEVLRRNLKAADPGGFVASSTALKIRFGDGAVYFVDSQGGVMRDENASHVRLSEFAFRTLVVRMTRAKYECPETAEEDFDTGEPIVCVPRRRNRQENHHGPQQPP